MICTKKTTRLSTPSAFTRAPSNWLRQVLINHLTCSSVLITDRGKWKKGGRLAWLQKLTYFAPPWRRRWAASSPTLAVVWVSSRSYRGLMKVKGWPVRLCSPIIPAQAYLIRATGWPTTSWLNLRWKRRNRKRPRCRRPREKKKSRLASQPTNNSILNWLEIWIPRRLARTWKSNPRTRTAPHSTKWEWQCAKKSCRL